MQKQGVQVEEGKERDGGGEGKEGRAVGEGDSETMQPQSVSENDCVKHLSLNSTPFSLPSLYPLSTLYPLPFTPSISPSLFPSICPSPSHFAFLNSAYLIITCLLFTSPNELRFGTLPP